MRYNNIHSLITALLLTLIFFLTQISDGYEDLSKEVRELNVSITIADEMLKNISGDMDEIMTFIEEDENAMNLYSNISAYRLLIKELQLHANASYDLIVMNQEKVLMLNASVNGYINQTMMANENLLVGADISNRSIEVAQMANSVEQEISAVKASLYLLEKDLDEFDEKLYEEIADVDVLVMQLEILNQTLADVNLQLELISVLSEMLENSTMKVKEQSEKVLHDVEIIEVQTFLH